MTVAFMKLEGQNTDEMTQVTKSEHGTETVLPVTKHQIAGKAHFLTTPVYFILPEYEYLYRIFAVICAPSIISASPCFGLV